MRAGRRRWREMEPRRRKVILCLAAVEGVLKVAALADLRRRPAAQVRGPKGAWAAGIVLINSAGGAPLAYFVAGRRLPVEHRP